ncbi:MAG: 4Fe-4S binding protein [Lentimicrobiaceae bacterium]|nr:4Fe-4S binding protein [Lentimicrobiaceae bacterium]
MESFHHALKFKYDLCMGCSHCTSVCPTGAIHVEKGHPILNPNRCIDCGRCYLACPVNAIYIEQDDFQTIYNYKYPVVLIPSIFSAQFPETINQCAILSSIHHLGFQYVYETEKSVDIVKSVINKQVTDSGSMKPIISTFCPAIVRLIQVKYPSLVSNLLLIKPPLDLTAMYIKKFLTEEKGIPAEDIGVFYVSPCAAKIAAIKSPVGDEKSPVDGVLNMNYFYSKVYRVIKQGVYKLREENDFHTLSKKSILWSLTEGEINNIPTGRNLAIDEVHNVSQFLDKVENEDVKNIDFLELRACDQSCAGGILCAGNRFLIAERQKKRAQKSPDEVLPEDNNLLNYKDYLVENIKVGKVYPRSMDKLDDNISIAMRKMKKSYEINDSLPQVDCRICGYQTCKALSEAIVNNQATLKQCFFVQRILEQTDRLTTTEAMNIIKAVWGDKKLNKDSIKSLNLE